MRANDSRSNDFRSQSQTKSGKPIRTNGDWRSNKQQSYNQQNQYSQQNQYGQRHNPNYKGRSDNNSNKSSFVKTITQNGCLYKYAFLHDCITPTEYSREIEDTDEHTFSKRLAQIKERYIIPAFSRNNPGIKEDCMVAICIRCIENDAILSDLKCITSNVCVPDVTFLSNDQIKFIVDDVCRERNVSSDGEIQQVLSNVINIIMMYVPYMMSGEGGAHYIESISDSIRKIMPLPNKIGLNAKFNSKDVREVRDAKGYATLFNLVFPGDTLIDINEISNEEYIKSIKKFCEVSGCNLRERNGKNETVWKAYKTAVNQYKAPNDDAIRRTLITDLKSLSKTVSNKMAPSSPTTGLTNPFKIASYLATNDNSNVFAEGLLDNLLEYRNANNSGSWFEKAHTFINIYRDMLAAPIILKNADDTENEWADVLTERFKTPEDASTIYYNLLEQFVRVSLERLVTLRESLNKVNRCSLDGTIISKKIETIGAIIGEIAVINDKDHYIDFVQTYMEYISDSVIQSMLAVATCHVLKSLDMSSADKTVMLNFVTSDYLKMIETTTKNGTLEFRIQCMYENIIMNYLKRDVKCAEFTTIPTLLINIYGHRQNKPAITSTITSSVKPTQNNTNRSNMSYNSNSNMSNRSNTPNSRQTNNTYNTNRSNTPSNPPRQTNNTNRSNMSNPPRQTNNTNRSNPSNSRQTNLKTSNISSNPFASLRT